MPLTRSSPLLTTAAQVTALTGVQDLPNLESEEFTVANGLLRAHEWVYDRIEQSHGKGAPERLSNETRLERCVAYLFLEILGAAGYLDAGGARAAEAGARGYWGEQAEVEVDRFRPQYSDDGDEPRRREGTPVVRNAFRSSLFSRPESMRP